MGGGKSSHFRLTGLIPSYCVCLVKPFSSNPLPYTNRTPPSTIKNADSTYGLEWRYLKNWLLGSLVDMLPYLRQMIRFASMYLLSCRNKSKNILFNTSSHVGDGAHALRRLKIHGRKNIAWHDQLEEKECTYQWNKNEVILNWPSVKRIYFVAVANLIDIIWYIISCSSARTPVPATSGLQWEVDKT